MKSFWTLLLLILHRKRCCQTNTLSSLTRKMTPAHLSLPQFPHLGHEAVVAYPWCRLHPCKQVLIRRIDCCELRTSSIRSGRSASPAVEVGRSKQAICRRENNGKRMPCGAIASYSEQSYARSKALHCITGERIKSAGQRGTVLVLFRTCSGNLSAEQISRHKGRFKYFEMCRVSKIPRDLLACDTARHCMTAGSHKLREHPPRRCCVSVVAAHALGRKSARPVPPRPGNRESI